MDQLRAFDKVAEERRYDNDNEALTLQLPATIGQFGGCESNFFLKLKVGQQFIEFFSCWVLQSEYTHSNRREWNTTNTNLKWTKGHSTSHTEEN
jgi:hypothetical protein